MILKSAESTIECGKEFAKKLKGGEVLALSGDLGSGKTTFLKGLAEGLRVDETITSPTFVILKKYSGRIDDKKIEFVHVDAYRIGSIEDAESVGLTDYFGAAQKGSALAGRKDVIVAIEWPEKISKILPKNIISIQFKHLNEKEREIDFSN